MSLLLGTAVLLAVAKDPIVMSVGDYNVPRSEFEYFYKKSAKDQQSPISAEEYADMFALYKMKVAAARESGLDTMASIRGELNNFIYDIIASSLADSTAINVYVDEAYNLYNTEAEFKCIILNKLGGEEKKKALIDSLRTEILAGRLAFEDAATRYSDEALSAKNSGRLGWLSSGNSPYELEKIVFNLPEGKLSEVVETETQYVLAKGGKKRPARGALLTAFISIDPAKSGRERAAFLADSLSKALKADPRGFYLAAHEFSSDRESGKEGGRITAFKAGDMPEIYDSIAYNLMDKQVSDPFKIGDIYFIIKRLSQLPLATKAEKRAELIRKVTDPLDSRGKRIIANRRKALMPKFGIKTVEPTLKAIDDYIESNGLDSRFIASMQGKRLLDGSVNVDASALKPYVDKMQVSNIRKAKEYVEVGINNLIDKAIHEQAIADRMARDKDFAMLAKEYEEGSLLFELSMRNVWNKATRDYKGIQDYFARHKNNYNWISPKAKGYMVQAGNDSIAAKLKMQLAGVSPDSVSLVAHNIYGPMVNVTRFLCGEGEDRYIDYAVFHPEKKDQIPSHIFFVDARLIESPEEVSDVRAEVVSDYQNYLEEQWIESLRRKYPVVLNLKEIKRVKL